MRARDYLNDCPFLFRCFQLDRSVALIRMRPMKKFLSLFRRAPIFTGRFASLPNGQSYPLSPEFAAWESK